MEDNIITFLGRFHPLVVHLPIGILLLAGLMQIISLKSQTYSKKLNPAISFTLFWGGISSLGAIFIGWLLSLQGGYDADTLFWHKWLGIALTVLSFFSWLLKSNRIKLNDKVFYAVLTSVILLVAVTGHLGGNLTHGESYLVHYAPNFIKKMAGVEIENNTDLNTEIEPDSIQVYPYFVQPILDKKCTSCHNPSKKEGGLLLTNHKEIFEGGDNGSILDTKDPYKSELLNRVTLPKSHRKFMPPKGNTLTFGEIKILEWWMRNGADSITKFSSSENLDKDLIHTLLRDYKIDLNPKPYYEKVKVDSLPSTVISELIENNFDVNYMGETNNTLSITYKGKSITKTEMEKLLLAKEQITWLNLSKCNLADNLLPIIENFNNLTRLNLHSNPITDSHISAILNFKHLESVNLYNTKISDESLEKLVQLASLRKLYIWKTDISEAAIKEKSDKYSNIDIISRLN